jgi:glycosyltransferase involved in cell wall biosynthesis
MTPRLSIVTAVYNHGQYLRESAESVLRQTVRDIELVIVNDGSTDNSVSVTTDLVQSDGRVRVLHNNNNEGLAYSLNRGIAFARAPWVMKVDADDFISPHYVEAILRAADADPRRNVIFSPCQHFGARTDVYRYPAFNPARMVDQLMIAGCGAFQKALWAAVGGYDESMRFAEDWDLHIRAQLAVGLVPHQLPSPLWHYRQHAGPRASAEGMARLGDLRAYWRGHTRESVLAGARSWGQWQAERMAVA